MKNAFFLLLLAAVAFPLNTSHGQSTPDDFYDSGVLAFREQRFAEAARDFEKAIEAQPEYPEAYFLLARI